MRRKRLSYAKRRKLLKPYWKGLSGRLTIQKKAWIDKIYREFKLVQNIQKKKEDRHYKFVPGLNLHGKTTLKTNKGAWVLLTQKTDKIKVSKEKGAYVVEHGIKEKGGWGRVDIYKPINATDLVENPQKYREEFEKEFGEHATVHLTINGFLTTEKFDIKKFEEYFNEMSNVKGLKKLKRENPEALNATVEYVRITLTKGQYDSYIRRKASSERPRDERGRFTKIKKRKTRKK